MTSQEHAGSRFDALVVMDYYLPGHLAGGPVTTLRNLFSLSALSSHTQRLLIITRAMDIDGSRYDVCLEVPQPSDAGWVIYVEELSPSCLLRIASDMGISRFYFNSFFSTSTIRFLTAVKLCRHSVKIAVAPRGEFSEGALRTSSVKKQAFLRLFLSLGLDRLIEFFHASSPSEAADIARALGNVATVVAADPLPEVEKVVSTAWSAGVLPPARTVVFLSRIVPKKNLLGALEVVAGIVEPLRLEIHGPQEDPRYATQCLEWARRNIPTHHQVEFMGACMDSMVSQIFERHRVFLFPTMGENFGHVVPESLTAGCPVVTTDATPWQDLEDKGVGAVRPSWDIEGLRRAVAQLLDESDEEHLRRRERCRNYGRDVAMRPEVVERNDILLRAIREM